MTEESIEASGPEGSLASLLHTPVWYGEDSWELLVPPEGPMPPLSLNRPEVSMKSETETNTLSCFCD